MRTAASAYTPESRAKYPPDSRSRVPGTPQIGRLKMCWACLRSGGCARSIAWDRPLARAPELSGAPEAWGGERRTDARRAYGHRVIALAEDATRVLLGRDISLGGMRVDPNPELGPGDRLRLAIHVRARSEPLVVSARVIRDDGEQGLVLEFQSLSD